MFPNGKIATPETIAEKYPAVLSFTHIVETDDGGEVLYAIENFSAMKTMWGIDRSLSEAAAIEALEAAMNAKPEPAVTPEERIAAALEYNNLLSMED